MTTRRNARRVRWLAVGLTAALAIAACSDDDDDSASTTAAAETTEAAAETTEAAAETTAAETETTEETESTDATETTEGGEDSGDGLTPVPDDVDLDADIVMAYSVGPTTLDPDLSAQAGNNTYMWMAYDRLTEVNNDLEVVPMLATEWSYSDDGTTFDMTLREDVTFHDGTPFNADAVVANIERSLTVEGSATARALTGVTGITKTGEYEVQFATPEGRPANLPVLLAGNPGAMLSPQWIANPTDLKAAFADNGSGPYRITEYRPGQGVSYERAPNFWDPGRQLAATFSIDLVDPAARINGVRAGEFDLGQSAASDSAEAISIGESGGFGFQPIVINTVYGALFNPTMDSDLANPQIREAIRYAMDLEAINEGLFEGRCEPRWQAFPEDSPYFFPSIEEQFTFDQAEAERLIAESGIENPSFDIEVSPGSYEPFAAVMQSQLADVGITMNIVPAETTAVPTDFVTGAAAAVYLVVLAYPDLGSLWANWFGGPFSNLVPEALPEAAAIRAKAATANDAGLTEEEQLAIWEEVFMETNALATFAPGCAAPQVWMWGEDVIGGADLPYNWQGSVVPYNVGKTA